MEEVQRSKRRRVYSFEPNAMVCAGFSQKYLNYLLLALLKARSTTSCGANKDKEIERIVRFEVDMALALSAGKFRWSRALKRKLEKGVNVKKLHETPTFQSTTSSIFFTSKRDNYCSIEKKLHQLLSFPPIPMPLVPAEPNSKPDKETRMRRVGWCRNGAKKSVRGEGVFGCRLRILRRILPGGSEMGVCELLSEVESYVVCLQLQVDILRSLVAAH